MNPFELTLKFDFSKNDLPMTEALFVAELLIRAVMNAPQTVFVEVVESGSGDAYADALAKRLPEVVILAAISRQQGLLQRAARLDEEAADRVHITQPIALSAETLQLRHDETLQVRRELLPYLAARARQQGLLQRAARLDEEVAEYARADEAKTAGHPAPPTRTTQQ